MEYKRSSKITIAFMEKLAMGFNLNVLSTFEEVT
jgi:hypothetical protein